MGVLKPDRSKESVKRIFDLINLIHEQWPDLRLGQLLTNAVGEVDALFYMENEVLYAKLSKYFASLS
jgi:hypothetical protein